jgi:hypothetical protein
MSAQQHMTAAARQERSQDNKYNAKRSASARFPAVLLKGFSN